MNGEAKGFMRHGAWMVAASLAGGVGMMLVHSWVSKRCGGPAYAEFKTLLSTFYGVAAVGGGLWLSFGQRTASAVTVEGLAVVAGSARRTLGWIGLAWVGVGCGLWAGQERLMAAWKLSGVGGLWATWLLGLLTLGLSVLRGIVQGRQAFLTLGWVAMLDGAGRLGTVALIVSWWQATAAGAVLGAAAGCGLALAMAAWGSRGVLTMRGGAGHVEGGGSGVALLAMQAASMQVFQQYDNVYWAATIPASAFAEWSLGTMFSPAQTVGFGITQFTVPLVLVMLPRVARARALGEGTDTLRLTMACTLGLGGLGAMTCTAMPRLPLQVMFFNNPGAWAAAPLVPWFAWAMVAFTAANVLLNDMVARGMSRAAWVVLAVALAYVGAMHGLRPALLKMQPMEAYRAGVQALCGATVLLLAASATARRLWTMPVAPGRPRQ